MNPTNTLVTQIGSEPMTGGNFILDNISPIYHLQPEKGAVLLLIIVIGVGIFFLAKCFEDLLSEEGLVIGKSTGRLIAALAGCLLMLDTAVVVWDPVPSMQLATGDYRPFVTGFAALSALGLLGLAFYDSYRIVKTTLADFEEPVGPRLRRQLQNWRGKNESEPNPAELETKGEGREPARGETNGPDDPATLPLSGGWPAPPLTESRPEPTQPEIEA